MKILTQVNDANLDDATDNLRYAVVVIDKEARQYLAERFALFNTVKKFSDDLAELRFYGCSFITFYNTIITDGLSLDTFDKDGFIVIPDTFEEDGDVVDIQFEILIVNENNMYVLANNEHSSEIKTSDIPLRVIISN